MPNPASMSTGVARSTTPRPSAVISTRVVRRSVGWATRRTSRSCSRRSTALVTLVGWTIRRSPILLIGSDPRRLKWSSTSAS